MDTITKGSFTCPECKQKHEPFTPRMMTDVDGWLNKIVMNLITLKPWKLGNKYPEHWKCHEDFEGGCWDFSEGWTIKLQK